MTEINKNCANNSAKESCCKKIFTTKKSIAVIGVIFGVLATLLVQSFHTKNRQFYFLSQPSFPFLHNPAFADNGFFDDFKTMEKEMNQAFIDHQKHMKEIFEEAQKNSQNNNQSKISASQDDQNYYYQLDFSGFKKEEISVNIKDKIITFFGESKKSNQAKDRENQARSNFYYSFMVTDYDSKKAPEIIYQDNKIVVKLAKNLPKK
ncbi:MAG: Hsp20/alpha crystallin family protein [Rickettsiales bacterium]|nr:Hsp20/alpha crystallin family protein [Rickettsiales bacterium]